MVLHAWSARSPIDDVDNRPSLKTVLSTAVFYGLDDERARQIVDEIVAVVDNWHEVARQTRIASADVDLTAGAFWAHETFRDRLKEASIQEGSIVATSLMSEPNSLHITASWRLFGDVKKVG